MRDPIFIRFLEHTTQNKNSVFLPLNPTEALNVFAMISYIVHSQESTSETVTAILLAQFGKNDIHELAQEDYNDIISFMTDLLVKKLLN